MVIMSTTMTQESLPEQPCCCICGRLLEGGTVEAHHLIPKTFKGTETVDIHKICHQKIHATFSERELQHYYHTPERLCEHEEMSKFIKWVAKKDVAFYDKNDDTKSRKKKRRR